MKGRERRADQVPNGIYRMLPYVSLEAPKTDTKVSFHVQETYGEECVCKNKNGGNNMVDKRQTTVGEVKELMAASHCVVLSVTLCLEPIENIGRLVRKLSGDGRRMLVTLVKVEAGNLERCTCFKGLNRTS